MRSLARDNPPSSRRGFIAAVLSLSLATTLSACSQKSKLKLTQAQEDTVVANIRTQLIAIPHTKNMYIDYNHGGPLEPSTVTMGTYVSPTLDYKPIVQKMHSIVWNSILTPLNGIHIYIGHTDKDMQQFDSYLGDPETFKEFTKLFGPRPVPYSQ